MILNASPRRKPVLECIKNQWLNRKTAFVGFSAFVILLFMLAAFGAGVYLQSEHRVGPFVRHTIPELKRNTIYLSNKVSALLHKPEIEHITIDIKHKNFMQLAYKRDVALALGTLFSSADDYVNAHIRYGERILGAKLRLKGDETDHFEGSKWSFRVVLKGEDTLWGMKYFSIQHPATRKFVYEWILHQLLKREGLIYHRYKFIDVTINGEEMGIYALEEHTDKLLIEHNRLREGPILKFNEELAWQELYQQGKMVLGEHQLIKPSFEEAWNGAGSYLSSSVEAFQSGKWMADSSLLPQLKKAVHLLEAFRYGDLATSQTFDVKKLATYFAIMDVCGAYNGTQWPNVRFYYNPITGLLEPIGRDGSVTQLRRLSAVVATQPKPSEMYWNLVGNQEYFAELFRDRIFFSEYMRAIERLSTPSYLDDFFSSIQGELEDNLLIIQSEFPEFSYSKETIYQNQNYIRSALNPVKGVNAHFVGRGPQGLEVELGAVQPLPIEVISISCRDSFVFRPTEPILLAGKTASDHVTYQNAHFQFPAGFSWADSLVPELRVNYRLVGTQPVRQEALFPWPHHEAQFVKEDFIRQKPNVEKFNFLAQDNRSRRIVIRPGDWELQQSLIIPPGYQLCCSEKTRLKLGNRAMILSYSPLQLLGTEEYPVVIEAADSTGQGIVVMGAEGTSVLDHVVFKNLSNPSQNGWQLTGAVNFYESPVQILHTQFIDNHSEDALNIIRTHFRIDETLFSGTSSDAFDGDFVKGVITRSSFVTLGNDAIDISGSAVEVREVYIEGAGDKGLSNGEVGEMTVRNVKIKNSEIAVASKDISNIDIEDITITDGRVGFTAYQKKPEFGSGTITAQGVKMANVTVPYLVENGSKVLVDDNEIPPSRDHVESVLYGTVYGKASR